jgi:hypothetical protein
MQAEQCLRCHSEVLCSARSRLPVFVWLISFFHSAWGSSLRAYDDSNSADPGDLPDNLQDVPHDITQMEGMQNLAPGIPPHIRTFVCGRTRCSTSSTILNCTIPTMPMVPSTLLMTSISLLMVPFWTRRGHCPYYIDVHSDLIIQYTSMQYGQCVNAPVSLAGV